jgi:hypothetical protein
VLTNAFHHSGFVGRAGWSDVGPTDGTATIGRMAATRSSAFLSFNSPIVAVVASAITYCTTEILWSTVRPGGVGRSELGPLVGGVDHSGGEAILDDEVGHSLDGLPRDTPSSA